MKSQLKNSYKVLPKEFYSLQDPATVPNPFMVLFNESLFNELGLDQSLGKEIDLASFFGGNLPLKYQDSLAMAYAGHQFGHFTMLGDGRAILLGEAEVENKRFDIQLKGSGRTTYSRGGDGKSTLGSMLREYIMSECMNALNIPTSRSLAVVATDEDIVRQNVQRGGVLTRVASSHIRVGTFEYARRFLGKDKLEALLDYTVNRHYPSINSSDEKALDFLRAVVRKQVELVVHWMRVGFIHGVINTDNTTISGETIDYGPCAFMNVYDPKTVFSSIDRNSRYAFGKQPAIIHWNLAVLAGAILPLVDEDEERAVEQVKAVLEEFKVLYKDQWQRMMLNKLGIKSYQEGDDAIINGLLKVMFDVKLDYTNTYAVLSEKKKFENLKQEVSSFKEWSALWEQRIAENIDSAREIMKHNNPTVIPRNHLVEEAIAKAVNGDYSFIHSLIETMSHTYRLTDFDPYYTQVPTDFDESYQTFCGT